MNISDNGHTAQRSYRFLNRDTSNFKEWLEIDLDNSSVVQDLLMWNPIGKGFGKINNEDRILLNNYYLERYYQTH